MIRELEKPLTLITGAGRGIGLAIAHILAAQGHDLAIIEKSVDTQTQQALTALEALGARLLVQETDIANIDNHNTLVARIQEKFGKIDHLVNNAGIAPLNRGNFLNLAAEDFDRLMAINLRGTVFFTQAVLKAIIGSQKSNHDGDVCARHRTIVNITSVSAALTSPERLDYCMSKAALSAFSAGLSLIGAEYGVHVFEVRPGIIRTDMTKGVAQKYEQKINDGLVPLKRWGTPQDIGRIVAQLVSGHFAFATGSIINADGGLSIHKL